ncbi:Molybdenum-pterin-binding protein 2 [bioreactor metagenome]|uniref:Molybdenum-pterin-binding protein 2 n=1 Tax=bioreactor metagenome TaxID=1076179 RepID=A0A645IEV5_9ZZZZ|nr:TOBE domain-containing protein [Proteiniphilum sp.]MEA4917511.1 TOBE domain-containing protein [Proteiniphilum sp.]MEA4950726.1 TOBE domain-containing protein [Petrimonas sp.]
MKLSARNDLKGTITDIKLGAVMAKVTIDLGNGQQIVSVITVDSVEDLDLKVGEEAHAIIKSTEVLVGK